MSDAYIKRSRIKKEVDRNKNEVESKEVGGKVTQEKLKIY